MRISQLARSYDLSVQEIVSYLQTLNLPSSKSHHPNAKLSDETIEKVVTYFGLERMESESEPTAEEELPLEVTESSAEHEAVPEAEVSEEEPKGSALFKEPQTPLEDIALAEGEIELPPRTVQPEVSEANDQPSTSTPEPIEPHKEDEVIPSDRLLEMLEAEERPEDLEKIKLIKAPKKELSGLKVLGKIDIPEPKKKEPKEATKETQKKPRKQRQQLNEEEKEKRRLRAKRKKEAYEARQEKRRKEKEEREKKARREAYYRQNLERANAQQTKQKLKKLSKPAKQEQIKETKPQPKTLLGKVWRWLNSSGYE